MQNLLNDNPIIVCKNLSYIFKDKKEDMINSCLQHRAGNDFSFPVKMTNNYQLLYKEFNKFIDESFSKFTRLENTYHNQPKCWAYLFDDSTRNTSWHNHIDSASINGVFYLKLTGEKENGILFRNDNTEFSVIPDEFDLLLFAGNTDHYPMPPDNRDLRLSINMESMCEESVSDIFRKDNLKYE